MYHPLPYCQGRQADRLGLEITEEGDGELIKAGRAHRLEQFGVDGFLQRFAKLSVGLNEPEQAFAWLERAWAERADSMTYLKVDPRLDGIAR